MSSRARVVSSTCQGVCKIFSCPHHSLPQGTTAQPCSKPWQNCPCYHPRQNGFSNRVYNGGIRSGPPSKRGLNHILLKWLQNAVPNLMITGNFTTTTCKPRSVASLRNPPVCKLTRHRPSRVQKWCITLGCSICPTTSEISQATMTIRLLSCKISLSNSAHASSEPRYAYILKITTIDSNNTTAWYISSNCDQRKRYQITSTVVPNFRSCMDESMAACLYCAPAYIELNVAWEAKVWHCLT